MERITGKVRAFVSGIDTETDVSSEVVHLEDPSTRRPPSVGFAAEAWAFARESA
jgi:hypothetical protein